MKELKNSLWMVTLDNNYSYDNTEKGTFFSVNQMTATTKFKEIIKDYIDEELSMAKELFDRDFDTLDSIVKFIDLINKNKESIQVAYGYLYDFNYNYGIDISEDKSYALFTINREYKTVNTLVNREDVNSESVCIVLKQIEMEKEYRTCNVPSLNNVADIDTLLNTL